MTAIGRISQLDRSTLLKIQAGCNYVNAEIKRLRSRVTFAGVLAFIGAAIWYAIAFKAGEKDPRFPLIAAILVTTLVSEQARRELKKSHKSIVVRRIVAALGTGLKYSAESELTRGDFTSMDLFNKNPSKWKSEDQVCGRKNDVSYSLHEVRASYTQRAGKHNREVIIFKGVIVRLDFNKNFRGHTIIIPDRDGRILGGLMGESESRRSKQIARLENPDFERLFSVYTTDDQEARYLLTPKVMELVMKAQVILGAELRLSFHDNSLFVTVPHDKDRFEVSLFGARVTPEGVVGEFMEVIQLAERLVDVLDLETRIWSRV